MFGLLLIVIAAISIGAASVYRGEAVGPFDSTFVTSLEDYQSSITLVCPPADTKPLDPSEVAVRVLNGSDTNGLASDVADSLANRGFRMLDATNYSRGYDGVVKILFGSDGIAQAYTVALHFTDAKLVLDNREGTTVDVVLGAEYEGSSLVSVYDDSLNSDAYLHTDEDCLPWTQIEQEPAPATIPDNPLATVTASPSPEASASGE